MSHITTPLASNSWQSSCFSSHTAGITGLNCHGLLDFRKRSCSGRDSVTVRGPRAGEVRRPRRRSVQPTVLASVLPRASAPLGARPSGGAARPAVHHGPQRPGAHRAEAWEPEGRGVGEGKGWGLARTRRGAGGADSQFHELTD